MSGDQFRWVLGLSIDDRLTWGLAPVNPSRRARATAFPVVKFPHGVICELPAAISASDPPEMDLEEEILRFFEWLGARPSMAPLLDKVASVGVSTIGVTDHEKGRLLNIRRKNWKRSGGKDYVIDFAELFDKILGRSRHKVWRGRLSVRNDATAKCLAHYRFQKEDELAGRQTLCFVNLSEGINIGLANGVGPVASGRLHPEYGHAYPALNLADLNRNEPKDQFNGCPAHRTCFEGLASSVRIRHQWGDKVRNLPQIATNSVAWKVIADYVSQICWHVALATAPDLIFLGGETACERLVELVQVKFDEKNRGSKSKEVEQYLPYEPSRIRLAPPLPMEPSFDQQTGLWGALEVARLRLTR